MDYKIILAIISVVMTLIGYSYYFRDMFNDKTKPHAFSWLVWGTLIAIAFVAQITNDAGPGAWITGVTAIFSFFIFGFALTRGEKNITKTDWVSLCSAGAALCLWAITNNPLTAIILVTIIDALGFIPTWRKSFNKPGEETLIAYFLAGLKFVFAIMALENYSIITWLYPASLVIANWLFVIMLIIRRKQLTANNHTKINSEEA